MESQEEIIENKLKEIVHRNEYIRKILATAFVSLQKKVQELTRGNATVYLKGGTATALLLKKASEQFGDMMIPPEYTDIISDWDCSVMHNDQATHDILNENLFDITKAIFNSVFDDSHIGGVIQSLYPPFSQYEAALDRDYLPIKGDPLSKHQNIGGIYYFKNGYWGGKFTLFGYALAVKKNRAVYQVPLIDIALLHPFEAPYRGATKLVPNPDYGHGYNLTTFKVPVLPMAAGAPDVAEITLVGYDEMWLDLMNMVYTQRPKNPNILPKKWEIRRSRFARILKYIFCTPKLFMLTTPIRNYKLIIELVKRTPRMQGGVCKNKEFLMVTRDDDGLIVNMRETLEMIIWSCSPDMIVLLANVVIEMMKEYATADSVIDEQKLINGFKKTTDSEKCQLLERLYLARGSWYANEFFQSYETVAIFRFLQTRSSDPSIGLNAVDDSVECTIKRHDLIHYNLLTDNADHILSILDQIIEQYNRELRSVHNSLQFSIAITGGFGFSYHLKDWYAKDGDLRSNIVYTADMDISIYPNRDISASEIERYLLGAVRSNDANLARLACPEGRTQNIDSFYSGSRYVVHYGYLHGNTNLGDNMKLKSTPEHVIELFFQKFGFDPKRSYIKDPKFNNVYYSSAQTIIDECNTLISSSALEPYKYKKYLLRSRILTKIQRGDLDIPEIDTLFNVDGCSKKTQETYQALFSKYQRPKKTTPIVIERPVDQSAIQPALVAKQQVAAVAVARREFAPIQQFVADQQRQAYADMLEAKRVAAAAEAEANRMENEEAAVRQAQVQAQDDRLNRRYLDNLEKKAAAAQGLIDARRNPAHEKLNVVPRAKIGEPPRDQATPEQLANLEKNNQIPELGAYQQAKQAVAADNARRAAAKAEAEAVAQAKEKADARFRGQPAYAAPVFPGMFPVAPAVGMEERRARDDRLAAEAKAAAAKAKEAAEEEKRNAMDIAGGSTRGRLPSLPTRRGRRSSSSSKRRYTHRQRASRTGKGGYRPTKSGRKA